MIETVTNSENCRLLIEINGIKPDKNNIILMENKSILLLLVFFYLHSNVLGQVSGKITNTKGEPLSFATIYVKNSTQGTTSNMDGDYELDLEEGNHEIIFQYVGFEQQTKRIDMKGEPIALDVVLNELSVGLKEVVVSVEGEDPAYAIIRKAIKKREYYLEQVKEYKCDVYIKGLQKVADVPEKIMGMEIGDLGGILDSTGTGIVYLSESVSKLHFKAPNQFKEEMISSKVSGNDNGFSFNQANVMDFNFYKNTYDELGRKIVSPIANNAFNYYKYKLEGAFVDETGHLVNKIEVIRKRDTDPSLAGYIYIIEDLWNIHSVDMWTNGEAFGQPIMDTMSLKQVYVPVQEPDVWRILSNTIYFKLKIFGIKINGDFTGVYSNYDVNPDIPKKYFDNQVLTVNEDANTRDSAYWEEIRPVPLTLEEEQDYVKKDSLQEIWSSKEFLDSMDRKSNKFKFMNVLGGYTYTRSYDKWNMTIGSPLSALSFNAVQGYFTNLSADFEKLFDDDGNRYTNLRGSLVYGFSDKQLRGKLGWGFNLNKTDFTRWGVEGGRMAVQFNEEEPISEMQNTGSSLFFKKNNTKYYDKYYGRVKGRSELFNGFELGGFIEYAHKKPLFNTTNHSYFYKDEDYFSNNPTDFSNYDEAPFVTHEALTLGLDIQIRIKQKYLSYPNRKFILGTDFPTIKISYRRGIPILGGDTDFDFVSLALTDRVKLGIAGTSKYNLEGGMFLSDKSVPFTDFHHFNGNTLTVNFMIRYLDQFRMLEYYEYSTTKPYVKLQWEHHFDGVILGKIPGIRKLQWGLVAGTNILYSEKTKAYSELFIGIDKIGWGIFRLVRIDFVTQLKTNMDRPRFNALIGVEIPL